LGLFDGEKCVSTASVKTMDGYSRIDDVTTHLGYRGHHLATKLITYLVDYHSDISDNYLYLYTDNPVAIRMYRNVGFEEISNEIPWWRAFLE